MDQTTPIFELKDVSLTYGTFAALRNVSLEIMPGERVALAGSSGAGKSTLIGLLNGTLRPSHGQVQVLGQNLTELSPKALRQIQRQIGTVYQQFHLVNNLRVIHNVNAGNLGRWSFIKAIFSLIWPLDVARTQQALTQVGIAEKMYEPTARLSGGQQQRVAIARVLVQQPQAFLADEPISSLDPERSREIMDLLRNLSQQTQKTLVTSLHDIAFARSHCQRIVGLRHGEVLFDTPATALTNELISQLYKIEA
jgi:phosphonate transport system ATP-binding protein